MKKNGFTLVELLAVIVLIAIITTIGVAGIGAAKDAIYEQMWNSTVKMIENRAVTYGEDHLYLLNGIKKEECNDEYNINSCISVTVENLILKGYIATKDIIKEGNNDVKAVIDNRKQPDEAGYNVNEHCVFIWYESNRVYSKYTGTNCSE